MRLYDSTDSARYLPCYMLKKVVWHARMKISSHGYSLGEITVTMLCSADEEVIFSENVPHMTQLDTNCLFLLRSCGLQ